MAKRKTKQVVAKDLGDSIMALAAAGKDIVDVRPGLSAYANKDDKKAAEIDAAWAQHTGAKSPITFQHHKTEVIGKVIFANREEINQCYCDYLQRKKDARLKKQQDKAVAALPVLADRKYHNLGDLKMLARAA